MRMSDWMDRTQLKGRINLPPIIKAKYPTITPYKGAIAKKKTLRTIIFNCDYQLFHGSSEYFEQKDIDFAAYNGLEAMK